MSISTCTVMLVKNLFSKRDLRDNEIHFSTQDCREFLSLFLSSGQRSTVNFYFRKHDYGYCDISFLEEILLIHEGIPSEISRFAKNSAPRFLRHSNTILKASEVTLCKDRQKVKCS